MPEPPEILGETPKPLGILGRMPKPRGLVHLTLGVSILISTGATLLATLGLTALAKPAARRLDILDRPHGRKVHRDVVPYLGGAAMFLGLLVGLVVFAGLAPDGLMLARSELAGVVLGGMCVCALGLLDDARGLTAPPKLFVEALVAIFMWNQGLRIEQVTLPFGETFDLGVKNPAFLAVSLGVTIAWYILLMNAVNLVDGLDGLAAGVSAIAGGAIVLIAAAVPGVPNTGVLIVGMLTVAACVGFLRHNWHPATIFMGDSGALLLGFLLATVSLVSSTKSHALLALLVPLLAVGLPVFESVHSFARRALLGKNPFKADRRHLHHRLLDLGFSHRRVVVILLYITAFLGLMSYVLAAADSPLVTMLVVLLLGGGLLFLVENLTYLERRMNGSVAPKSADGGQKP